MVDAEEAAADGVYGDKSCVTATGSSMGFAPLEAPAAWDFSFPDVGYGAVKEDPGVNQGPLLW